jgi:hypothetical protein
VNHRSPTPAFPENPRQGAVVIVVVTLAGVAITFVIGGAGCATDGSFELGWAGADPSRYSELTRFPGAPDSLGSMAVVAGLSLGPALAALMGLGIWQLSGRPGAFHVSLFLALLLLFALFVITAVVARVDFAGV